MDTATSQTKMSPDLELPLAKRRQISVGSGCDLRILCDLIQKINKNMQVHKRAILDRLGTKEKG